MHDPADAEFWLSRWQQRQTGFHRQQVNEHLLQFWPALGVPAGATVFVPLCGKSLDLVWLQQQGHRVVGVELSTLAANAFFSEQGIADNPLAAEPFVLRGNDELRFYVGDFFHLQASHLQPCHALYDRAALVALPASTRKAYVEQLLRLFPAGVKMLLVTLEYDDRIMQGPPFSVTEAEVNELFGGEFDVARLQAQEVIEDNAHLRERGLNSLVEKVYLLDCAREY